MKLKITGLCFLIVFAAWWFNRDFLTHAGNAEVMKMNDHSLIVESVQKANFSRDHWGWWNASTAGAFTVYRPLMTYFSFAEVKIGLRYGWVWVGWIGFALYLCCIASSSFLAWRWTRHWTGAVIAASFCVLIRFFNKGQQDLWLIWFSGHQETLMMALVLLSLAFFDTWLETGKKAALIATWGTAAVGCLVKEYVYIFPLMAMILAAFRPGSVVSRKKAFAAAGWMLLAVLALAYYRSRILTGGDIRNPTIKPVQFLHKPILFCYNEVGRYLLTGQLWLPLLGLLWFVQGGLWVRARQQRRKHQPIVPCAQWKEWIVYPPGAQLLLFIVVGCAIILLWRLPLLETLGTFFTGASGIDQSSSVALIVFDFYTIWLVWKYRRTEMGLVAWCCWVFSYAPVLDYIGWHYTLGPLMLKGAYLAVVVRLIAIDTGALRWWKELELRRKKSLNLSTTPALLT